MLNVISTIINVMTLPIMLMNFGSGIIGGLWLAYLGQWRLLIIGITWALCCKFILGITMFPSMLLAGFSAALINKRSKLVLPVGFFASAYINFLIIVTCVGSFILCYMTYDKSGKGILLPYLLWAWGMGLGPWQIMTSRNQDNDMELLALTSASVFYLLFLFCQLFSPMLGSLIFWSFAVVQMLIIPGFGMYVVRERLCYEQDY